MHGSGLKRTNHRDIQRRHRGGAAADRMTAAHRCPNLEGSRFFVRVQVPMQNQRKNLFIVLPQGMIIRTTLSKWVMCSDLSFLLRIFCKSKGGNEKSCPCFFCIMQLYLTCVKKVNDLFSAIKAGELNWISTKILLWRNAMPSMPDYQMEPSQG